MKIVTIRGKRYRWSVEKMNGSILILFLLSGVFAFIASLWLFVAVCIAVMG